jgi:hypothetical protein
METVIIMRRGGYREGGAVLGLGDSVSVPDLDVRRMDLCV